MYLHALMTTRGVEFTLQAAWEMLAPEQRALRLERFPRVLFLHPALLQEEALDVVSSP